ncbi:MAG: hypothetical protein WC459_03215 [Patescibacteria group bacterium]
MFESSKDILYLILAFCILWLTIFLSWLLFYFISILRNVSKLVKDARSKYLSVEKAIASIKEKIESGASHLGLIAEAVKRIVIYFLESKISHKKRKK